MKKAIVLGAGGFIGSHMVKRLKTEGFHVVGIDLKLPEFSKSEADLFIIGDLRDPELVAKSIGPDIDELYQFAADMGGAGFVFTGENDADIMHNSALVNLNVAHECVLKKVKRVFYSSSACMYPEFGPEGTWEGGREKAPAALCRKASLAKNFESIEVWGPGNQTRSFLYIDECIEATIRLMRSDCKEPLNIGSEEMLSINDFARIAIEVSTKNLDIYNIDGQKFISKYGHKCPIGVNGRNSDNTLYEEKLGWKVSSPLIEGMKKTYEWINKQTNNG